jgi:hypothetical protein
VASQGRVRIAVTIQPGGEPLPKELVIVETLAHQLGLRVLLGGCYVPGGGALLTLANKRRVRAEFKTLTPADARAFEHNVREASRQTGAFPSAVALDARGVGISATEAERLVDRAIRLVAPRRP